MRDDKSITNYNLSKDEKSKLHKRILCNVIYSNMIKVMEEINTLKKYMDYESFLTSNEVFSKYEELIELSGSLWEIQFNK